MPPAIATIPPMTTSGIANLCQREVGGLRRRLRMRVAIGVSDCREGLPRPSSSDSAAIGLAERIGSRQLPVQVSCGRGRRAVKLVIGIVRPEQANEVLEALYRAEVKGFSVSRVQGHGGELDRVETYRGTTVKMGLSEKVRFEAAVSDDFVDVAVEALCEGARTGEVGDGKIFVLPLERAVRIRTGEPDEAAVTPVAK